MNKNQDEKNEGIKMSIAVLLKEKDDFRFGWLYGDTSEMRDKFVESGLIDRRHNYVDIFNSTKRNCKLNEEDRILKLISYCKFNNSLIKIYNEKQFSFEITISNGFKYKRKSFLYATEAQMRVVNKIIDPNAGYRNYYYKLRNLEDVLIIDKERARDIISTYWKQWKISDERDAFNFLKRKENALKQYFPKYGKKIFRYDDDLARDLDYGYPRDDMF